MLDMKDKVAIDPAPVDVGARFRSRAAAERAVRELAAQDIAPAQVEILEGQGHMRVARSAEKRATRTALIRWHALLGAAGLLVGALCWLFAWYARLPLVLAMPGLMLFVAVAFGVVAGLLLGGLLSIRPTKGWLAAAARDDARAGDFPVVVHATDRKQAHKAREILAAAEGDPYLFGAGS
ncbi:hypothetical protein [Thioalkalivibrio sp. XN279]|uniref:hypothetical protein n=1 Tax=Thioalkalivibrio sp. XN279 TaxID=2714953 RepID=UPI001408641F|nr:hypothetical protein [Thioalkalivibrio sp. XN279]NHA14766.1 hypothetical protein [Thioalkalivibrio sp. XN279]